jgi:group I intron endonuclease
MTGIYKITNPNGKIYIGQSVCIERRKVIYKNEKCKRQPKVYNSIKKYGFSQHIFEIIEECTVQELNKRERYWQDFYEVLGENGLNLSLTNSNDKSGHISEEVKKVISEKLTGRERSQEHCNNIGKAKKGKESWWKGHIRTEEHQKNLTESLKGKSSWSKGKTGCYSEETYKKWSENKQGDKNPMYGKKQKEIECPHCKKVGGVNVMKRWHFQNCKK